MLTYARLLHDNERLRAELQQRDAEWGELAAENERLRAALGYIAKPTLGWSESPGDGGIYNFVANTATDRDVRAALKACIYTARAALVPSSGETAE